MASTDIAMKIRIGASGFSYKEWLGHFYPAKFAGAKMLSYYAERLPAVEINYTFRRMPKAPMFEGWAKKTPPDFRFALKASQRITHFQRLRGIKEPLNYFIGIAGALGDRLGPVLFQLPPDLARDDALLVDFIGEIRGACARCLSFATVAGSTTRCWRSCVRTRQHCASPRARSFQARSKPRRAIVTCACATKLTTMPDSKCGRCEFAKWPSRWTRDLRILQARIRRTRFGVASDRDGHVSKGRSRFNRRKAERRPGGGPR